MAIPTTNHDSVTTNGTPTPPLSSLQEQPSTSTNTTTLFMRFLNGLNNLLHVPVLEDFAWHLFWFYHLCLGPVYAALSFLGFLFNLLTGAFFFHAEEPKGRAVLITGCDTGFGHNLALELVKKGWKVYAGCLTEKGLDNLTHAAKGSAGTMVAVQMDVTKPADIERVVKQLVDNREHLHALVCNAGIGRGGLVDWTPLEEYRSMMEVNFFAMVSIVKACLPLLKESKGRIINVTSIAGVFLGAPCMSAYSASKHAAEAFTTALRLEVRGWGIKVSTINPSFHKTGIATNATSSVQRSYQSLSLEKQEEYGLDYLKVVEDLTDKQTQGSWDPENVVRTLVQATTATNPRTQYVVGSDARFYLMPLLSMPTPVVESAIHLTMLTDMVPAKAKKDATVPKSKPTSV